MKSEIERTFTNFMASVSRPQLGSTPSSVEKLSEETGSIFEGQLSKFTNVVKGWQYRWFVLDSDTGTFEYFLLDDGPAGRQVVGKSRGAQKLCGCLVIPSDEDSQTFTVNFGSGEAYKLRAENAKERQIWVHRLRRVALMFDRAVSQNQPHISLRESLKPTTPPPGAKSQLTHNGEPTDSLQNLTLSVLDAFGSAYDILQQSDTKHQALAKSIESLPIQSHGVNKVGKPTCHDEDLLMLKATSQSALICLENALAVLQDLQEQHHVQSSVPEEHSLRKLSSNHPFHSNPFRSTTSSFKRKISTASSDPFSPSTFISPAPPASDYQDNQHL